MTENWYERHLLPYLIDLACGIGPVGRQRQKVVPQARGRVLEVGIGTGRNIPYYDKSRVSRIVGVDPALRMHHLADQRIRQAGLSVELMGLSAEKLPTADEVAALGYRAMQRGQRVYIPGFMNWAMAQSMRFTPRNLATKVVKILTRPIA